MADSSSETPLPLRLAAIGLSVLTFLWIQVEDTTVILPLAFSASWCLWAAVRWNASRPRPRKDNGLLWCSALSGLAVTPLAFVFILLKAGVHDHGFLDLTEAQLKLIAKTTPAWVGLGVILSSVHQWSAARRNAAGE